ncbi:MAG: nuclear transport factor 2 family protein [Pseudomonadota bacterium]
MTMTIESAAARYIDFFNQFEADDLERFGEFFLPDARFQDPFNDVRGLTAIRKVFAHMYRPCPQARFTVLDHACHERTAYLHWSFVCTDELRIEGMSRVVFAANGLVSEHIDYWDPAAQIYERIPLLGVFARWLRRRLAAHSA